MEDEIKSLRTLLTHVLHTAATQAQSHHQLHSPTTAAALAVASSSPYHGNLFYADGGRHQQQLHHHQLQQQQQQQQPQQRPRRTSLNLSYGTINNNHDEPDNIITYATADEDGTDVGGTLSSTGAAHHGPSNGHKYDATGGGGGGQSRDNKEPLMDDRIAQIVRDNVDLRSDLSSALEGRKMAESKITS